MLIGRYATPTFAGMVVLLATAVLVATEPEISPAAASVEEIARQAVKSVVVITVTGRNGQAQGLGTGFVVSPDGLIATNLHVIGQARPISVQFADGRKFDVTSVHASDQFLDLALVRIDATDLPALTLGDSQQLAQGQRVVAIGNPHGLKHSVVSGLISGTREIDGRQMFQLAIPIEPGNSGSPIVDLRGRVQGVVTMKSVVTDNLGFAIQINELKPLLAKPNTIPMSRWLTIGALDLSQWKPLFGAHWRQRAGKISVTGSGKGFGGRSLCLWQNDTPARPYELAAVVRFGDKSGAAGLVFHADGHNKHYGFYPSNGRLRLSRFEGPSVYTWAVLREVESEHYRPGDWNHLKVRLEEDKILCYVNDHLVIQSTDAVLSGGKVGLAKFRNTDAEFKQFRVAQKLPPSRLSTDVVTRINQLIDETPSLESITSEQLAPLAGDAPASLSVLRDRSLQLEKQADELRRLSSDIHVLSVTRQMKAALTGKQEETDLARLALLIAKLDDEEVDVAGYLAEIDRMAAQITAELPNDADELARLTALNKYMFADNGFHGSRTNYYNPANSYLNQVIDDREGLPITLSVLYMELGRRIGLNVVGVGLPGHFVVRHVPATGEKQLIDVFDGAVPVSRDEAARRVAQFNGTALSDEHLGPYTKRRIAIRMLKNLLGIAQQQDEKEVMLRYLAAMLVIDPDAEDATQLRGLRAIVRFETGRRDAAIADLDSILKKHPPGIDLDKIRKMRNYFANGR